jgi:16S rRNA (guanine1516-N2)-methyltransferase
VHRQKQHQHHKGPQELLVRAVGFSKKEPLTLFDATAGFLTETFLLLPLGIKIIAVERCPLLALLVQDGLDRALQKDPVFRERYTQQLCFSQGDSQHVLQKLEAAPDVIYLDPMFPERHTRSAHNKKEMRILRYFVGEDHDIETLFTSARRIARKRVVVKRPHYAPPLVTEPHFFYKGKHICKPIYSW